MQNHETIGWAHMFAKLTGHNYLTALAIVQAVAFTHGMGA